MLGKTTNVIKFFGNATSVNQLEQQRFYFIQ